MIGGNLIEVAAGLAAFGTSASLFTSVYVLKRLRTYEYSTGHEGDVQAAEYGWKFNIAWFMPCLIVPILFTCVYTEIYESLDITDSAVSVLSLFWVYLLLMTLWVFAQYIFSTFRWIPYLLLLGAFIVAGVETGYVFVTLHSTHWYHHISWLFFIPPLFAVISTYRSNIYRDRTHEVISSRPITPMAKSKPFLSGTLSSALPPSSSSSSSSSFFNNT